VLFTRSFVAYIEVACSDNDVPNAVFQTPPLPLVAMKFAAAGFPNTFLILPWKENLDGNTTLRPLWRFYVHES